MRYLRDLVDIARCAWDSGRIEVGPLIITTHNQEGLNFQAAFDVGRDVGAVQGPAPRPARRGFLSVVA